MMCPYCQTDDDTVGETRRANTHISRVRKCKACGRSFHTTERLDEKSLRVVNRSGGLEAFDRQKIANGIRLAGRGKPLLEPEIAPIVDRVVFRVLGLSDASGAPITTRDIGRLVLDELRTASPAAQIRFAAVFWGRLDSDDDGFATIDEFLTWVHSQYDWLPMKDLRRRIERPTTVIKRSGRSEEFQRDKIKNGVVIALRGRRNQRSDEEKVAEKVTSLVEEQIAGQPFVRSGQIGDAVLRTLESEGEEVGYIRFAILFKQLRQPLEIWLEANALRQRRL